MLRTLLLAGLLLIPFAGGWCSETTVYYTNSLNGWILGADPDATYSLNSIPIIAAQSTGINNSQVLVPFNVTTAEIAAGETINGATVYCDINSGMHGWYSTTEVGIRQILYDFDDVESPTWNHYNSISGYAWDATSNIPLAHVGAPDSSTTELDSWFYNATLPVITLAVSDVMPATMPADGIDTWFLIYMKTDQRLATIDTRTIFAGRLRLTLDYGADPTPTPTRTPTRTPTPTNTGYYPTETPTFTPVFGSEFGDREDNRWTVLHAVTLIEDGLRAISNDETDPQEARTILDRENHFVGKQWNLVDNSAFTADIAGWTTNASSVAAWDGSYSALDPDNSGSMAILATADGGEATQSVGVVSQNAGWWTYGCEVRVAADTDLYLRVETDAGIYEELVEAATSTTEIWKTYGMSFELSAGDEVEAVGFRFPDGGSTAYLDNIRLYDSPVLLPYIPKYLEDGGIATLETLTVEDITVGDDLIVGDDLTVSGTAEIANASMTRIGAIDAAGLTLANKDGVTSIFVEDGGAIGVGTSAPDAQLHVYDDVPAEVEITVQNSEGSAIFGTDGGDAIIRSDGGVVLAPFTVAGFVKTAADGTLSGGNSVDHGTIDGLADDDHTGYARLAGRADAQTLIGSTEASEDLTLQSTSNATRGTVVVKDRLSVNMDNGNYDSAFGSVANDYHLFLDASHARVGIGTNAPDCSLHSKTTADTARKIAVENSEGSGTVGTDAGDLILDASDDVYTLQDLGVGAADPGYRLVVSKNQNAMSEARFLNSTGGTASRFNVQVDGGDGQIFMQAVDSGNTTVTGWAGMGVLASPDSMMIGPYQAAKSLYFQTAGVGTKRLEIQSDGDIVFGNDTEILLTVDTTGNELEFGNTSTNNDELIIDCDNGNLTTEGDIAATGKVSCAYQVVSISNAVEITGHQNSYNPANYAILQIMNDGSVYEIRGISGGTSGRVLTINNVDSTVNMTIAHNDTVNAAVGERIYLSGLSDKTLSPYEAVTLYFDGTGSGVWRETN